ncbi:MAG: hypothetical protein GVX78_02175 [Bacteroidetes bacterium]|jgi:TrmH family RNA methyltransferase|nr:hypothetical protein [Bacteroidota bacterium]
MNDWSRASAKHITQLQQKKYRLQYQQFVVEGPKLVEEALQQNRFPVRSIIGTEDFLQRISPIPKNIDFYPVSDREVKKISSLKNPQGGMALLDINISPALPSGSFLIYLDALQNPGNLGTIFRSAEWFGVDGLIVGEGTVDPFNSKVVQSSMGSLLRVAFSTCSWDQLHEWGSEYTWVGADVEGTPLYKIKPPKPLILAIGNEGQGLSKPIQMKLNDRVSIPQHPVGQAESLNAALSASVIMYEWSKK